MFGLTPFYNQNRKNDLSTEFHSLIDNFFNDNFFAIENTGHFTMDVRETEDEYIVDADLPGILKENIKLSAENGQLSISVRQDESKEEKKTNYLHRERRTSAMQRSVYLPYMDPEQIQAKFDNGVLTVHVHKTGNGQSTRDIEIQ